MSARDGLDRAVQQPAGLVIGGLGGDPRLAGLLVDHVAPEPLQEPVDADDVAGVPGPARVERAHEHLVEPQRVGAVVAVDVVGRDRVLQALAHLAVLALHLDVADEEATVTFDDLRRLDVEAALVA